FWALWQSQHPNEPEVNPEGDSITYPDFRLDVTTTTTQGGVSDLCYTYGDGVIAASSDADQHGLTRRQIDDQVQSGTGSLTDPELLSQDPSKLPYPSPLPDAYISRMGLNKTQVRYFEERDRRLITAINRLDDYVAASAPIYLKRKAFRPANRPLELNTLPLMRVREAGWYED
ncbi:hypothetical protein HK102_013568, partial [Quaeritorhiza haematococci]